MAAEASADMSKSESSLINDFIKVRKKRHLSQAEVARKASLHQAAVGRIENKSTSPRLDTMLKMLDPMGYTLAIVPSYKEPEHSISLEINSTLDCLDEESLRRVKAYAEALREEDLKKSMDAYNEFSKLCRPMDIDKNYKSILEEELTRRHGNPD